MDLLVGIAVRLALFWVVLHQLVQLSKAVLPLRLLLCTKLLWQSAHLLWAKEGEFWSLRLLSSWLACCLALALRRL